MHGKIIPIDLAEGSDAMSPGPRSIINFYDEQILKCKKYKGR